MRSQMFLNGPTVIDHAYVDVSGRIIGGSFNPNFIVSGEIDPVEKVVVDFSSVKKEIKGLIDDRENGFDHKLWVFNGWSLCEVNYLEGGQVSVSTPWSTIRMPADALCEIDGGSYDTQVVGDCIGEYVEHGLSLLHPGVEISVQVVNKAVPDLNSFLDPRYGMFRYTHGLKDSTSWGCQNIAHGHLSFIQLVTDEVGLNSDWNRLVQQLIEDICTYLDNATFVNRANVVLEDSKEVSISYTTERGEFRATYELAPLKVLILDTETTVEYLAEHVASVFGRRLKECGVRQVFISEGLNKGAVVSP